jgi:uncharacterized protein
MYQPRKLAKAFRQALANFPAVLLTGPRQSGKTTFLRQEAGERVEYLSFDDPLEREFATNDPVGFLDRFKKRPFILDEIQYVPTAAIYGCEVTYRPTSSETFVRFAIFRTCEPLISF